MGQHWKYLYGLDQDPGASNPFFTQGVRISNVAHASEVSAAAAYNGLLWYDSTNHAFQGVANGSTVTLATSSSVGTLDQVFDVGKVIDGADKSANRVQIGDGTADFYIYGDGTDVQIGTDSGDLVITPQGGDISVAGNLASTGDISVGGDFSVTGSSSIGALSATTSFAVGSDGSGVDAVLYSGTAGDSLLWDASEKTLVSTDAKIQLQDGDDLLFGDGAGVGQGDFKVYYNSNNLYIAAVADVASQAIYLGDDTNDVDVIWEGDTNNAIFQMDSSTNQIELNGCDMRVQDNDVLHFGDGAAAEGDFKAYCDGTDLFIAAGANVSNQAVKIGDATNEVDIIWYGTTSGDLVKFDSSDDSVLFTDCDLKIVETGAECALDVSSAATGADCTVLAGTAALTDGYAVLGVKGTGNIGDGGAVCNLDYSTGTPHASARILELQGAGKDLRAVVIDVDSATNHALDINCGGALGSGKAIMSIAGDAAVNAGAHVLLVDASNATFCTNNPIPAKIISASTSSTFLLESRNTGALGAVLELKHNGGDEANDDVACRIQFTGEDDAHADEAAGRIDVVLRDETAANPDFDVMFYTDVAGTETLRLELNDRGVAVGDGAGAAYLGAAGAQSLVLETNGGTNSASITVASGANSDVTIAPAGTGDCLINCDTVRIGDENGNALLTTWGTGDITINTNSGTNSGSIVIADAADGDISITPNGAGSTKISALSCKYRQRDVAAGTATDSPVFDDGLVQYATDGASACAVTLPEAANNLGLVLTFQFDVDGGKDVVISRAGADTIDETGDVGNVTYTMANAGECISLMAVADNIWLVLARIAGTLA